MSDALAEFLQKYDWDTLGKVMGWHVERDDQNPDVIRFTLPAHDGETYILRCVCDEYPKTPPSVQFINCSGAASDMVAWPFGDGEFHQVIKLPPECFLCTDLTREGLSHHPEWKDKAKAWSGKTHTLMNLFNYVQNLLKSDHYQKRAQ
jgi:hypothetical protein